MLRKDIAKAHNIIILFEDEVLEVCREVVSLHHEYDTLFSKKEGLATQIESLRNDKQSVKEFQLYETSLQHNLFGMNGHITRWIHELLDVMRRLKTLAEKDTKQHNVIENIMEKMDDLVKR